MTQQTENNPKMSQNVVNVQFSELEVFRWEQFTHMKDAGLTDFDIALKWHLKSIKQVQRLKQKAKQTGAFKQWMDEKLNWISEEFPELHAIMKKKNPRLAYLVTAKLYAKAIPTRIEETYKEKTDNRLQIDLNVLNDADKSILDRAARLLESKGAKRLSDLH
jgi:hypothetical protein